MRENETTARAPKVSIVIPVFNAEGYFTDTLRGLTNQTYTDFEVIFVDDGSTDKSLALLTKFAGEDCRAKVLTRKHQYAGAARNYGMAQARGEFLLFLDADDFFAPDMLEKAVKRAERTKADICVFRVDRFDQNTGTRVSMRWACNKWLCPIFSETFSRRTNPKNIFWFTTAAPWNKLFRRDFVSRNKLLFQDTRSANDMAFVMTALAAADRIAICDAMLLTYRVNNSSSLQGSQHKKPDDFYLALLELRKRLRERGLYVELEPAFLNFALDTCIYNLKTLSTEESFENIFYLLKNTAFQELDLVRRPREYFYAYKHNHIFENREDIINMSADAFSLKNGLTFSAN